MSFSNHDRVNNGIAHIFIDQDLNVSVMWYMYAVDGEHSYG